MKIRPAVFAVGDDKKKGKERESTQSHKWVIFQQYGEQTPLDRFPQKNGKVVEVEDVIIQSNLGVFSSAGGQIFRFPIDFAGHR